MAVSIKINAAARMTQIAQELYDKGTGYSQARRASALDFDKLAIRPNQDTDCSFAQGIIWVKAGLIPVSVLRGTFYSGNIASVAKRHGFQIISLAGKSLSQIKSLMREGDALVGPGHVVHVGPNGRVLSWEQNELGKASGGKPGRQPGEKVGWRNMYARSRGWAYLMRPPAVKVGPVGLLLGARQSGNATVQNQALGSLSARWKAAVGVWDRVDKASPFMTTIPTGLTGSDVVVVLGSGLTEKGGMSSKLLARCQVALSIAKSNPSAKLLLSGGKAKQGNTEAKVANDWLVGQGVAASRLILEQKSGSTIGNAKHSAALMGGFARYWLVSHGSHLRRAAYLFESALASKGNTVQFAGAVAVPDGTIGKSSLSEVKSYISEVSSLLGVKPVAGVASTPPPGVSTPAVSVKKRTPKRQSTLPVSVQQRIAGAKVDGKRGPETVSKLKALQKRLGVAQDGVWGPVTARAYLALKGNLRRGSVGPWVRVIQHAGGVTRDGEWGTNTDAAVREMQAWAGVTVDGVVGPASRIKIII